MQNASCEMLDPRKCRKIRNREHSDGNDDVGKVGDVIDVVRLQVVYSSSKSFRIAVVLNSPYYRRKLDYLKQIPLAATFHASLKKPKQDKTRISV